MTVGTFVVTLKIAIDLDTTKGHPHDNTILENVEDAIIQNRAIEYLDSIVLVEEHEESVNDP